MSYLPEGMPSPHATIDDAPFWQACQERRLVIRHCESCHQFFHPPLPVCQKCGSSHLSWRPVSGRGTVYSYTIGHYAVHPSLKAHGPYNVAVVLLDDADDVRLVSNVVDAEPPVLKIGLPVTVCFEPAGDGTLLPRFRSNTANAVHTQEAA